ncbi:MAG: hypothetical protein IT564_03580 [Rhodospirillales bacterium]|nr:hypothetical protein [Rhodospirillales bacterium]
MDSKRVFGRGLVAALALIAAGAAQAQGTPQAERPREAQEALARGFAFAQEKQWTLAIRYFRAAQQSAPADPAILLNLGLANQQLAGRELVAAAWYRAFLAGAPRVRESDEVRRQLAKIEIASETTIQKLLDAAEAVARHWPDANDQRKILEPLARARAVAGDVAGAQQIAARLEAGAAGWALAEVAAAHVETGNIDLAAQLVDGIKAGRARAWAQAEVAVARAARGDFTGALRLADTIANGPESAFAYSRIAALQGRAGDGDGAQAAAAKIDPKFSTPRAVALAGVALAAAKTGLPWRVDGALDEATRAAAAATRLDERMNAHMHIARTRAEAGDLAGAEQSARAIPDGRERFLALAAVARAKNDHAGAEIYRWTALALEADNRIGPSDINSLLKAAQGQSPAAAAVALAKAAEERARMLRAFRKTP